ncbi:ABC transporter permease [Gracilibacillus sp. S3-1-1]|uniref:ABC transporter permease n=1 Tax=Gracilibacillus pellucidus TaxID=3095368 RepID=A0ACC6M706_9BACI|nr:ABC transporter permease [Gracilibacillus sp. S3-1-1]MDX8046761.1 ABC transporter permease [Gracilibacillus sp. S3-1-1]
MFKLIKNEWIKMKSEKVILVIVILSLIPLLMNFANFVVNNRDMSLDSGFYFTYYNQYFMMLPIISSVLISFTFYMEFKNKMYLDWITYNIPRSKLLFSKLLISTIIMLAICIMQLVILSVFYFVVDGNIEYILRLISSYIILNVIVITTITLVFAVIIQLTKNIVASISIGIGVSLLSMILMAAPFSYFIPTAYGYRLGLLIIDNGYYYEGDMSPTIIGIGLFVLINAIMLIINLRLINKKRL